MNKSAMFENQVRTLIIMDCTGSMSNMINKTKTYIEDMFEKARNVLKTKSIDSS